MLAFLVLSNLHNTIVLVNCWLIVTDESADDDVELHVLGCWLTYWGQTVTSAEAVFSVALRPQKQ